MTFLARLFAELYEIIRGADKPYSAKRLGITTVLLVAVFAAAGYLSAQPEGLTVWGSWMIIAAGMVLFLAMVGLQVHDRIGGALIDERNLMSLSRLQLVAWTILISSGFLAITLARVFTASVDDPLAVDVPSQVWQLLGISIGSTFARGLVQATKKARPLVNPEKAITDAADALNRQVPVGSEASTTPAEVDAYRRGVQYRNPAARDASIVDMFQGDDVGNAAFIDMSKVQMFFLTTVALLAYAAALFELMRGTSAHNLSAFPDLAPGLVTILGMSHVGYVGLKALDHTN